MSLGQIKRIRVTSIKSKSGPTSSSGGFVAGVSPALVFLQNLNQIGWTDPGSFRGNILRTATNVWNGAMYLNPGYTGVAGSVLYDINDGPLGNLTNLTGSNAYSFGSAVSTNIGQAQITLLNTTTFGNCFCLVLGPQVSGFLTGAAWTGLPGIDLLSDVRSQAFVLPLTGNADRGLSDIPGQATFTGDWVL